MRTLTLAGAYTLAVAAVARAQDVPANTPAELPVPTWGKTSISAGVRYASDDFGVGIGGGAGYTLSQGIYLGNQGDYYFGAGAFSGWSVLLEGGYDFGIGQAFVLRPVIGAGVENTKLKQCEGDACSELDFAFGVGVQLYWFLSSWLNLGVDGRAVFSDGTFFIGGLHFGVAY